MERLPREGHAAGLLRSLVRGFREEEAGAIGVTPYVRTVAPGGGRARSCSSWSLHACTRHFAMVSRLLAAWFRPDSGRGQLQASSEGSPRRAGEAPNGVAVVVSTKTPIPLGRDSAVPERG
jgi:hypothetical protein